MVLTNLWSYQLKCGEEGRAESLETCIHVGEIRLSKDKRARLPQKTRLHDAPNLSVCRPEV